MASHITLDIDNHSSGYLVQHCVRAYLSSHCILAQKQYRQKLMAQLNSTAFFTFVLWLWSRSKASVIMYTGCTIGVTTTVVYLYLYVYFEAKRLFMENSVTVS